MFNNNNFFGDILIFRFNVMVDFKGNGIFIKLLLGESLKINLMSSYRKRLYVVIIVVVISVVLFGVIVAIVVVFFFRCLIDRVYEVEI